MRHSASMSQVTQNTTVNWAVIGSSNDLVPNRRQAISWTDDDILSTVAPETYFS